MQPPRGVEHMFRKEILTYAAKKNIGVHCYDKLEIIRYDAPSKINPTTVTWGSKTRR